MRKIIDSAKKYNITAIIASDIAVLQYAKSIGVEVHISTQQNVSNIEAVNFFSHFADVIVLARELNLNQIKEIIKQINERQICGPCGKPIRIELFAHGALCAAISGKCYMSLTTQNASANRGACAQNCRRSYRVIDEATGEELVLENKYIMSPKDLCTIKFLDQIIDAGVSVLKIEGRGRSAEYVDTVTRAYQEATDAVETNTYTKEKIDHWTKVLASVYNRGFWQGGYYLGKKLDEWSGEYGSQATKQNEFIGRVTNYFKKTNIGEFILDTGNINIGDELLITGETTGVVKFVATSIFLDEQSTSAAKKGDKITIPVPEHIRTNDKLFVVRDRKK